MKKILVLSLSIGVVTGCSYINSRSATKPLSQTEQICSELKRNIIFNTASVTNIGTASATQHAQTLNLYDKYGCSQFEKNR